MDYKFRYTFEHIIDHNELTKYWTLTQIENKNGIVQREINNLQRKGYIVTDRVLIDLIQ